MALDTTVAILKLAVPIAEAVPILGAPVKSAFEATVQILEYAGAVKSNKKKTHELAEHAATLFIGLKDRLDEIKTPSYNTDLDRMTEQVVEILMKLTPVFAAKYNAQGAPPGCLDGTRVEVIATILFWCAQPKTSLHIYWLAGHVGTGKSAIARTLSERLVRFDNTLVVTFFISKDAEDRRDPLRIIQTLVHQLAYQHPSIRSHVVEILSSQPDIVQQPLKKGIEELLLRPLQDLIQTHSLVVVIDALDECVKIRDIEGGSLILDLASVLGSLPIKLVITSRKEQSLERMFGKLSSAEQVELHEIEGAHVSSDVRLILKNGFQEIVVKHEISTSPWPSEEILNELIARTGRFIIFAATMLKFVDTDRISPQKQLSLLLTHTSANIDGDEYQLVDELYLNVLEMAARRTGNAKHAAPSLCSRIQALIGTIVLLYAPLSASALSTLMGANADDVIRDVRALSAVLQLGPEKDESGAPLVRIFHPSFRDFLLERCKDKRFSVDTTEQNHSISVSCLQVLNQSLTYDICDIKDPTIPHTEVKNPALSVRLKQRVPEAVRYACQFWINHIAESGSPNHGLCSALQIFILQHTFHWIELLSLTKNMGYAIRYLVDTKWSQSQDIEPCVVLSDTLRMLQTCWRIVETNALQVYYSGPIWMPQCALLKCVDDKEQITAHASRLISPRTVDWRYDVQVFEGHTDSVLSVTFSLDGKQIASGSDDKTVRLWDAQSGHQIRSFEGHTDYVRSVAFSPDGKHIASGSDDKTVRLWDAQSGHQIRSFEDHTDYVRSVTFSPDGKQIALGLYDNTVRLWDAQSGHEINKFEGHAHHVFSVAFSPDGKQIASGSSDKTARVWDAQSGHQIHSFEGHTDYVRSVAFSPDGKHIASGSDDKTVRVWDAQSGHQIRNYESHTGSVRSVAFSPDSKFLAAHMRNGFLRFWPIVDAGTDMKSLDVVTGATGVSHVNIASLLVLSFNNSTGWIMGKSQTSSTDEPMRNLCWLPLEMRGGTFATYKERTITIFSNSTYRLTVIDMGPLLDMLHDLAAQ